MCNTEKIKYLIPRVERVFQLYELGVKLACQTSKFAEACQRNLEIVEEVLFRELKGVSLFDKDCARRVLMAELLNDELDPERFVLLYMAALKKRGLICEKLGNTRDLVPC